VVPERAGVPPELRRETPETARHVGGAPSLGLMALRVQLLVDGADGVDVRDRHHGDNQRMPSASNCTALSANDPTSHTDGLLKLGPREVADHLVGMPCEAFTK
jgi:hypothetical protein